MKRSSAGDRVVEIFRNAYKLASPKAWRIIFKQIRQSLSIEGAALLTFAAAFTIGADFVSLYSGILWPILLLSLLIFAAISTILVSRFRAVPVRRTLAHANLASIGAVATSVSLLVLGNADDSSNIRKLLGESEKISTSTQNLGLNFLADRLSERITFQIDESKTTKSKLVGSIGWPEDLQIRKKACSFNEHGPVGEWAKIQLDSCDAFTVVIDDEGEESDPLDISHALNFEVPWLRIELADGRDMQVAAYKLAVAISRWKAQGISRKLQQQLKPELDKLRFTANYWNGSVFQVDIDGSDANVNAYDLRAYFVADGVKLAPGSGSFQTDGNFKSVEFVVEDTDGKPIDRRDVTGSIRETLSDAVMKTFSEGLKNNQSWECSIGGCQLRDGGPISLCSPMIKAFSARRSSDDSWRPMPRNCDTQDIQYQHCSNFDDFHFSLDPKQPVQFRFMLSTGKTIDFDIALTPDFLRYKLRDQINSPSFEHWVNLEPIAEKNPEGPAPIALLGYQADTNMPGGFRLASGLQGCVKGGADLVASDGWLVDQDGKGLVRQGHELSFGPVNRALNAAEAEDLMRGEREIAIAAEMKDGKRKGPYRYRVNPRQAILLAAARSEPNMKCGPNRNGLDRQWICLPEGKTGWLRAERVEFGPTNDNLSKVIDIDYGAEDMLKQNCGYADPKCFPFVFEIPENWDNIYYRITGHGGKISALERVIVTR